MSGKKRFIGRKTTLGLTAILIGLPIFAGCSKKESEEPIALKGRVEKIRRTTDSTGELTVRFFSEKQNKEISGSALITPETRIEKNGLPASFQDLQEGLQVNGQVRSVKEDGQRKFKAILIQIETPTAKGE